MNKQSKIFEEMLDTMDFVLESDNGNYLLYDKQRDMYLTNDFEEDSTGVFKTPEEIVERLDTYLNDYYLEDLKDEAEGYLGFCHDINLDLNEMWSFEHWDAFAKENADAKANPIAVFLSDHQHEFDVADMIVNGIKEVNLKDIALYKEEPSKKLKNENIERD